MTSAVSAFGGTQIRAVDRYFAEYIRRQFPQTSRAVFNLFLSLSAAAGNRHSCLELEPESINLLKEHPAVGQPGDIRPIIIQDHRLYLNRSYSDEATIAERLYHFNRLAGPINERRLQSSLSQHFFQLSGSQLDQQMLAAATALTRHLCIITGGPGTGKTSTVVKILSLLHDNLDNPRIQLAAPTGKAADRLATAIAASLGSSTDDGNKLGDLTGSISTLHRLLGISHDGSRTRHGSHNPLNIDVLIVDEASMIDQSLMARLLAALPDSARLILLGDPDQLPAVEAGTVLKDLCFDPDSFDKQQSALLTRICGADVTPSSSVSLLVNSCCHLKTRYRFADESVIGTLASKLTQLDPGDISNSEDKNKRLLGDNLFEGIELLSPVDLINIHHRFDDFYKEYRSQVEQCHQLEQMPHMLAEFNRVRVLSPVREGDLGTEDINRIILSRWSDRGADFFHGRPIMITRNNYSLGLFNGDTGICFLDESDQQLKVYFEGDRVLLCSRLPAHETCFATTVHKAQGSEFEQVILVLPDRPEQARDNLYSREMLYTAVTRAKKSLTLISSESALQQCVSQRTIRMTGLRDRLRPNSDLNRTSN